ncbi:hypothetical protein K469DRAFT_574169, partial [Zopfia rhizophila CBS 207.26]
RDEYPDGTFYQIPRPAHRLDDHGIRNLKQCYTHFLFNRGHILDLCAGRTNCLPPDLEASIQRNEPSAIGIGLDEVEMDGNPDLNGCRLEHDLKMTLQFPLAFPIERLEDYITTIIASQAELICLYNAAICVLSIDYLTRPREVLYHMRLQMEYGGMMHIVVTDRSSNAKVISRWVESSYIERLRSVSDYLHFSG